MLVLALLWPAKTTAQTDTRLVAAVHEARAGQSDSARVRVQRMLATTPASDSLYPQILYTAGIIASAAAEMRRRLQQVAIEFPVSSWADDALLRLVQLEYAVRDLEGAARQLERFAIGFPQSSLFAQAAYWAGRTYFDLKRNTDACQWLNKGVARAGNDIETRRQLEYLNQRCGNPAAQATETTKPATPVQPASPAAAPPPSASSGPPRAPTPPPSIGPRFRIQIAAVGTTGVAAAAAQKAQSLGYSAVTIYEGGLYKVRVGDFATRDEALQAIAGLKSSFGGNPFVVSSK